MKKEIRIVLTGGGSGGHIYPLIAVAENIKDLADSVSGINFRIYYIGTPGIYARDFLDLGVKIVNLPSVKIRRYFSLANILDVIKFPFVVGLAFLKMLIIMPDVLFSKGGTASLPVVIASKFYKVPIFIHESDTVPGLSNKFAYRFAKRVGVAFEYTKKNFWDDPKTAVVGNPIRKFLLEPPEYGYDKSKAKRILGFDPSAPLLLVIGGSLGSQRINNFLLDNIESVVSKYQVLHITGQNNFKSFQAELAVAEKGLLEDQRNRYKIVAYMGKDIRDVYIAADLIISRAGSGAIFEIANFGKPSILIPLKESAGNHQLHNAYEYSKSSASVVIEEDNFTKSIFFSQIEQILSSSDLYEKMSVAAKNFSVPQSALFIAKEIFNMLEKG